LPWSTCAMIAILRMGRFAMLLKGLAVWEGASAGSKGRAG
jgi:hypothetical protein